VNTIDVQSNTPLAAEEEAPHKIWNAAFVRVFIIATLAQYCVYSMNTLSGPYANALGARAQIVGLVSSFFAVTALGFKLISAPAIDAWNRKTVLILSLSILLVSFVGYTFSFTIPVLIVSRLLTGVGLAFVPTCCVAVASDALPTEKMSTGLGYFFLGTVICQAIAPAIGLELVKLVGYNKTFFVYALVCFSAILVAFTMKHAYVPRAKFRITLHSVFAAEVLIPSFILLCLNMVFCNVNAFLILFGQRQGVEHIGYFFATLAVTLAFTRPAIGKAADMFGSGKVIIASMVCFAASFLLISISHSLTMFLLAGIVSAFGYAGCQPALVAVSMKMVTNDRRGAASCTTYIGQDIGNLIGPVLAGTIIEKIGYVSMWRIMIVPIGIATIVGMIYRRRLDHAGEEQPLLSPPPAR
jgi:MFS family permease